MLALASQSRESAARLRKGGSQDSRLHDQVKVGAPRRTAIGPLLSLVVRSLGNSPLSSKVLRKDRARYPIRMERIHSRARVPFRPCARFFRATGGFGHQCLSRDDSIRRQGRSFQRGVPYKLMRFTRFRAEVSG